MRIGVLTYHCPPNFGAQLQAISTVGYLRKMGHNPIVLNWYPKDLEEMYSKRIPAEQVSCHENFTNEVFPLSKKCQSEKELVLEIDKLNLDGIIVGSDALFKYTPIRNRRLFSKRKLRFVYITPLSCDSLDNNPFWGSFLPQLRTKIPTSVFAVSSQNCPYQRMSSSEKDVMSRYLNNYQLISVRDQWTQSMVKDVCKIKNIPIYPDPVFSFNQNCYLNIPSREEILSRFGLDEQYMLLSFSDWYCDAEYIKSIANEVEKFGYQAVALPMPEKLFSAGIRHTISLPISPIDWYALIIYSKGYIGERMHPIVVCLHNSIPFFSFDEYGICNKKRFHKKIYDSYSSKTYQIVSDALFLNNLYSYQGDKPKPKAQEVVSLITNFDVKRCMEFSDRKKNEYIRGMNFVIDSLKHNIK